MYNINKSDSDRSGYITDIQRFSVHDGPGIRTTVFFKGCPLRCIWCHNPETQDRRPQVRLNKTRCTGCGRCAGVCPNHCHIIADITHTFNSAYCTRCFKCIDACLSGALEICGRQITAAEVIAVALRDRPFYGKSGGITISGGEPAEQPEFANAILMGAKEAGLSTCVQTCGAGINKLDIELCDYIYYDIKTMDRERHLELAGTENKAILDSLAKIASVCPEKITVRTVIAKGLTDDAAHVKAILAYIHKLGLTRMELNKFHPYGSSKAEAVGLTVTLGSEYIPGDDKMKELEDIIKEYNI